MRVLVIEDDIETGRYLVKGLSESGYTVDHAEDGPQGVLLATGKPYDVLIVDRMLPGLDGLSIIEALRKNGNTTPVLILSARDQVPDRVAGLRAGGDDYLTKPFAFAELLARIRAITRRRHAEPVDGRLRVDDLVLDTRRHSVTRGSEPIHLTPKEFSLLEYFLRNAGQVLSRTMITDKVWGHGFDSYSNLIDVHINHLRRKIERDSGRRLIRTVKGVGYLLEDRPGLDDEARG